MKQQINLLNAIPLSTKQVLGLKRILILCLIFIIILSGYQYFSYWLVAKLSQSVSQIEINQKISEHQLNSLKENFPEVASGKAVETQLQAIAEKIKAKKQIISLLSSKKTVLNTVGFSEYFTLFSETNKINVSLTSIHISSGGAKIRLTGETKSSDDVLGYIQILNKSHLFANQPLHLVDLSQSNSQGNKIFTLYSENTDINL